MSKPNTIKSGFLFKYKFFTYGKEAYITKHYVNLTYEQLIKMRSLDDLYFNGRSVDGKDYEHLALNRNGDDDFFEIDLGMGDSFASVPEISLSSFKYALRDAANGDWSYFDKRFSAHEHSIKYHMKREDVYAFVWKSVEVTKSKGLLGWLKGLFVDKSDEIRKEKTDKVMEEYDKALNDYEESKTDEAKKKREELAKKSYEHQIELFKNKGWEAEEKEI